ncbi:MAG: DUF6477 family protein [Paracoccaceae bacterium]
MSLIRLTVCNLDQISQLSQWKGIVVRELNCINRPKILVQAARHGVTTHERKSHLLHLFGWQEPKSL